MPVPSLITDCDTNAANNSPPGTESAKGTIDNYLRQGFAFARQNYDSIQTLTTNLAATNTSLNATKFPAGTAMLFQQTAAPSGWTKQTTHNNKALRVVSGTASSGGTVDFTTAFASRTVSGSVGNTTLSIAQIPSHDHTGGETTAQNLIGGSSGAYVRLNTQLGNNTGLTGGGGSHNHSFTGTNIDLTVQYVDLIIATKD